MNNQHDEHKNYQRRRKVYAACSLAVFGVVIVLFTLFITKILAPYMTSTEQLRDFLDTFGWKGRFILLGLQCLQIVVALIPGEVVELGAGYAYGALEGSLICLVGVALSSSLIFLLVKKAGPPLVEIFISREKIDELKFINNETKLKRLVFLLYLIPGTPKDVLTYFVGLTKMTLLQFLGITLLARIPSVLSSAVCGQMLGDQDYLMAGIVYAVTGAISGLGYYIYTRLLKRKKEHQKEHEPENDPE